METMGLADRVVRPEAWPRPEGGEASAARASRPSLFEG
jgi:hypothetical protein